jgi:hypothetical protein
MRTLLLGVLAMGVGLTLGCRDTKTAKTETKVQTETDAAGQPIETHAETAGRVPDMGTVKARQDEYIGVVSTFTPGKTLEVKMPDGAVRKFDLNDSKKPTTVEPSVKVGSKVEVLVEKDKGQAPRIHVVPHA